VATETEAFCAELRYRREAEGLSLQDVFHRTRINPAFLEALESGRFEVLPEAYVRLFLKKYAQEIGLDPDEALERYATLAPPHQATSEPALPQARPRGPLLAVATALLLTVGIGTVLVTQRESAPTGPEGSPRQVAGPRTPRAEPRQTVAPARTGLERVASAYSLPAFELPDTVVALRGLALASGYTSVSVDGAPVFGDTLSPGVEYVWHGQGRFLIEMDSAAALRLELQGNPLTPVGDLSRKHRVYISRSGIWVEEVERVPLRSGGRLLGR